MAKRLGSRREINKINKIHTKSSKKHDYSSSDIYSSDYNSYLSSDTVWYKII